MFSEPLCICCFISELTQFIYTIKNIIYPIKHYLMCQEDFTEDKMKKSHAVLYQILS